jgi:hypothetical protein
MLPGHHQWQLQQKEETQHSLIHLDHLPLKVEVLVAMLVPVHMMETLLLEVVQVVGVKERIQVHQTHLQIDKDIQVPPHQQTAVPEVVAERVPLEVLVQRVPLDGTLMVVLEVLEFNFQTLQEL